eukprot:TRINITY_DN20824_c0_g1_i1.p1 TRINITY_DN20824_c0_g1~~TRINITY_DN20824_c0_g1_i1.p1  ORF type:complete len:331 (-),score=30.01 TRINITY_DN20824_c0_g1_i1:54-914(-)
MNIPTTFESSPSLHEIFQYHVTFPLLHDDISKIIKTLVEDHKFKQEEPLPIGDAFFDTPELHLQSQQPGGMWLRFREEGHDNALMGEETNELSKTVHCTWNLRKCTGVMPNGIIEFIDIKDEQEILDTVWPLISPNNCMKPEITNKNNLLKIFMKSIGPIIAISYTRLTFVTSDPIMTFVLDTQQIKPDLFSISGTFSSSNIQEMSDAYQKVSEFITVHEPVRSKVIESLYHRHLSKYEQLKQANIIPDYPYFEGHLSDRAPPDIPCDYWSKPNDSTITSFPISTS